MKSANRWGCNTHTHTHTHTLLKNKNGITLIALVITIIVLLLLAGVIIGMLTENNGILKKVVASKIKTEYAVEYENVQLAVLAANMGDGITTESLNTELRDIFHNDIEAYEYESGYIYTSKKKYLIDSDGNVEIAHVPDSYQQVEYIESTGTQYINLNTPLKTTTGFYIKFLRTSIPNGDVVDALWGAYAPSYYLFIISSKRWDPQGKMWFRNDLQNGQGEAIDLNFAANQILEMTLINNVLTNGYDGKKYTLTEDYRPTAPGICLFGCYILKNLTKIPARVYNYQTFDEETIIQDLIPCYRKSDEKPGMYDLVKGTFFTNSGSDEFIVGPNVTE